MNQIQPEVERLFYYCAHVCIADWRWGIGRVQAGESEVVLAQDNLSEGVIVEEDVDGPSVGDLSRMVVFRLHAARSRVLVGPQASVLRRLTHG